ncbi:MAG: polysaccharide biosynthesis protein [Planctomycetota bacterium]
MRIAITGITGTLGTRLMHRLLEDDDNHVILGLSRCEHKQQMIVPHGRLHLRLCDIRDSYRLTRLLADFKPQIVLHLAALKSVPVLEHQADEAISTNVTGTHNVIDAADDCGAKVIFTSTDKACYPVNTYGVSKAIAERLVRQGGHLVVRYGNVLGSSSSVLANFQYRLMTEKKVLITHPDMTRFWMLPEDVIHFIIDKIRGLIAGDAMSSLAIPDGIQAAPITDLAKATASYLGIEEYKTEIIGIRPGEKIHETLRTDEEGELITSEDRAVRFHYKTLEAMVHARLKGMGPQ